MKNIRLLLVEDNRLLRDGIAAMLEEQREIRVNAAFRNSSVINNYKGHIMKRILLILIGTGLLLSLVGCSDEADPQFRIRNERSDKANVQLQTSGGNTININDVGAGQTTAYQSASEGTIVATAVIQNESVSPTATFFAAKDTRSTVVILAGNPPSLRIDQ